MRAEQPENIPARISICEGGLRPTPGTCIEAVAVGPKTAPRGDRIRVQGSVNLSIGSLKTETETPGRPLAIDVLNVAQVRTAALPAFARCNGRVAPCAPMNKEPRRRSEQAIF